MKRLTRIALAAAAVVTVSAVVFVYTALSTICDENYWPDW